MNSIVLHPVTKQQLESFATRPSHALLLQGAEGIGKSTISRQLAAQILNLGNPALLETYPYLMIITPEDKSISIETIRNLQQFTKLKIAASTLSVQRIIIIERAELLTIEAQNALLKLLEEPPEDTVLILTATSGQVLLPTIRSRVQTINIQQPASGELEKYFATSGFNMTKIHSAYLMSGGLPGLMQSLLTEDNDHPLTKAVQQARDILRATTFERLVLVDSLSKQRMETLRLLFVLQQMAHAALEQVSLKENTKPASQAIKRWQHILSESYEAETSLFTNAQPKLVLLNLLLNL